MKYSQFKAFEKHLHASAPANFSSIYCLLIKDAGERQYVLESLKKHLPFPFKNFDADIKNEKEFFRELDTFSLFKEKKVLHYAGCEKLSKHFQTQLEAFLPKLSSQVYVIFSGENLSKTNAIYKLIEKHGVILEMGEEKPWEKEKALAEWLVQKAQEANKTIAPEAVNVLSRGVNGNLAQVSNEWEKILTFVGDKKQISLQDVQLVATLVMSDSSWLIGESILNLNGAKAIEIIHRSLDQGNAPLGLLRQIRHQFLTALHLISAKQEGSLAIIATKYPYLKGPLLEKQMSLSEAYGMQRIMRGIQWIDYFEFKAKDQWDNPYLLFDILIARLA